MILRLTPAARDDLRAIFREGVRLFGEQQARRYLEQLGNELRFVGDFPQAVRLRDEFNRPVRVHRFNAHIIIFDIVGDEVVVARIRHGHEDWTADY
jgi:toxin ParE1/3/4